MEYMILDQYAADAADGIEPDEDDLTEWLEDGSYAEATDGCQVEPDGTCEHDKVSWLIAYGII
jgi:hypothetical protein